MSTHAGSNGGSATTNAGVGGVEGPLALEIVDTLTLLAPRGYASLRVAIEREPLRAGAFTAVLDRAFEAPPVKPDVGVDLEGMRAVLDEALGDLLRAMGARTGERSVAALRVERENVTARGASQVRVALLDAEEQEIFAIELPPRALRQLIFTDALFELTHELGPRIASAQQAFVRDIEGHDDWAFDQATRTLSLARGALPWRTYDASLLGTWARESETFLWAWANREVAPSSVDEVAKVRDALAVDPGLGAFRRSTIPCEKRFAGALAQLAAAQLGALGVFSGDYGAGELFLAVLERR